VFLATRRLSALWLPAIFAEAESQTASVPACLSLQRRNIPPPKSKCACLDVIRLIQSPVMSAPLYGERRTSCVLYIPRIPRDARYSQHACKGALPPLTPTKEGASPLCWILPRNRKEAA
jgi:hypothetical protein